MERPFEAYEGDEPYVFVCYSHDDKALVYPELIRLNGAGFHIWYDEGISPGLEWSDSIADHIERCAVFLYFVTPQSVVREYCRRELNFAVDQSRRVLAVHLVPTDLPSGLKLTLSNRQAILKHEEPRSTYEEKLARAIGDARTQNNAGSSALDPGAAAARRRLVPLAIAVSVAVVIAVELGIWFTNHPAREVSVLDRSLTVMPFSVIGNDTSAATYADALTGDLRTTVTGYQELEIVSQSDATDLRNLHQASYVLDGNVQRLANRMRIRAELTRADDDHTVWAKTFERPLSEGTDQAEIASTVGRFVRGQLVLDEQCEAVRRTSSSAEAARAYCSALAEFIRFNQGGDIDFSIQLARAQRAVDLDPSIADAYRIVASSYTVLAENGAMDWRDAARHAHEALNRGLALANDDPMLLTELGNVQFELELNYPAAEASYRASLASDPLSPFAGGNYANLGTLACARGNLRQGLEYFRRALHIEDETLTYIKYAAALWFDHQNREALNMAEAGLRLVQGGLPRVFLLLVKVLALNALGETTEANATLDNALASIGPELKPYLAGALAQMGRRAEAQQLLAQLETLEHQPIEQMVYGYSSLDDDRAFEWIHKAIDHHISPIVWTLRTSPAYEGLRHDARWKEVMAHLELEEAKGRAQHPSST